MKYNPQDFIDSAKGMTPTGGDIRQRLNQAVFPKGNVIGDEIGIVGNSDTFENFSSINGKFLCTVPDTGSEDIERAVQAAGASSWPNLPPEERKKLLLNFADKIEQHSDELALLDALDVGKPVQLAKAVDVTSALKTLRWYAEAIDKIYGAVAPTTNYDLIVREPIGIAAAIVPWNYPLMIAAWKFAPMLAAGNSVILKPAEESPLSAMRLGELALEAGLPSGTLNIVCGHGPSTGKLLGLHDKIRAIGFTGSTSTGKRFYEYASQSTFKSLHLECGGKSPGVIFADSNVEEAVVKIAAGIFYNAGQSCNAPTRILVEDKIYDQAMEAFVQQAQNYEPDNPLSGTSAVGAIVNKTQYDKIENFIQGATSDGATLLYGGKQQHADSGGWYLSPTVLSEVSRDMRVFQEEIFGPVLPITKFSGDDEALELCNENKYGLWANIFTSDMSRALRFAKKVQAGTVAFNTTFGGDITTPFGGYKESGTGRDRAIEGLLKYTQTKHISLLG